jgi:hypothetical protein
MDEMQQVCRQVETKLGLPDDSNAHDATTTMGCEATPKAIVINIYGPPKTVVAEQKERVLAVAREIRASVQKPLLIKFKRMQHRITIAEERIE